MKKKQLTGFISDDEYFLQGVSGMTSCPGVKCISAVSIDNSFRPEQNDVIFLSVQTGSLRRSLLKYLGIFHCRIFIIAGMPAGLLAGEVSPPVFSKRMTTGQLQILAEGAQRLPWLSQRISGPAGQLFQLLDEGHSIPLAAKLLGVGLKYTYLLKRRELLRFGLQKCNPAGVILCRDLHLHLMHRHTSILLNTNNEYPHDTM